jgi:hypothetical protein
MTKADYATDPKVEVKYASDFEWPEDGPDADAGGQEARARRTREAAERRHWGLHETLAWIATRDHEAVGWASAQRSHTTAGITVWLAAHRRLNGENVTAYTTARDAWAALVDALTARQVAPALAIRVLVNNPRSDARVEQHQPGALFPPPGLPGAARAHRLEDGDADLVLVPTNSAIARRVIEWRELEFFREEIERAFPVSRPVIVQPLENEPVPSTDLSETHVDELMAASEVIVGPMAFAAGVHSETTLAESSIEGGAQARLLLAKNKAFIVRKSAGKEKAVLDAARAIWPDLGIPPTGINWQARNRLIRNELARTSRSASDRTIQRALSKLP